MMRVLLREVANQQRLFWRSHESAFFTFLLPIILLLLLGSAYGDSIEENVKGSTFLLAGMLGYGVVATAFAGLAITLVVRREAGVLKRVRGTPVPTGVYLAAVIVSTLVTIALLVVTQLLVGVYAIGAEWPEAPLSFLLTILLGAAAFAALGLAITGAIKSAEGSSAIVNALYLPMTFLSGAFFSQTDMPRFLEAIGNVLPLTYLLRLLRDEFVAGEGLGSSPGAIAVLAVWGAIGLVLAVRMFKWEPREV